MGLYIGISFKPCNHNLYIAIFTDKEYTQHYNDIIMGAIGSQNTSLTIVYSTVYSDADQRKHQSSASLAFVWGIHRRPVNSPHKWPVTRKIFPFDDVIMKSRPYSRSVDSGALRYWSVDNSYELINKISVIKAARSIKTFNFSTPYTNLPLDVIYDSLRSLIIKMFANG